LLGYLYSKGLAQKKPGPTGRRRDGEGRVRLEEQAVKRNGDMSVRGRGAMG